MAGLRPYSWNVQGFGNHCRGTSLFGCTWKKIAVGLAIGVAVHLGVRTICKHLKRQKKWKRDIVILHQFPRATNHPNLSPYCLKLETYLRLAKIEYEVDNEEPMGPLGKAPWITYNEDNIPDSELCIQYLNKKHNINLNAKLSAEQVAMSHALRIMAEDQLVMCMAIERYIYDDKHMAFELMEWSSWIPKRVMACLLKSLITKSSKAQGLGRHSHEVIQQFGKDDLKALSDFLGEKLFFFGNQATEGDCALFGMLSMAMWGSPGLVYETWINEEFLNLKNYCNRVKELVFPDWEELLAKKRT